MTEADIIGNWIFTEGHDYHVTIEPGISPGIVTVYVGNCGNSGSTGIKVQFIGSGDNVLQAIEYPTSNGWKISGIITVSEDFNHLTIDYTMRLGFKRVEGRLLDGTKVITDEGGFTDSYHATGRKVID